MSNNKAPAALGTQKRGPTLQFAEQQLVKPQTVRKRYSATGSYFGIRPVKLSSGRLSWPLENQGDDQ